MSYYKKISALCCRGCGLICDFAHIFWDGTKFYKLWIKVKIEIKTQYTVGFSEMYICLNLQMNACTVYVCICQCLWIPINVFVNACTFLFNCVQRVLWRFVFIFGPCESSLCQAGLINFPLNCMVCPLKTLKAFKHLFGEAPASSWLAECSADSWIH